MGVPGFFAWLMRQYKKEGFIINKSTLDKTNKIYEEIVNLDYLLLDANSLIHPVCAKVLQLNSNFTDIDKLEDKMIKAVLDYIEYIIEFVNPKIGIYIAIDGVPPLGKIKQQRMRRFNTILYKKIVNNIKKKHNKPITSDWNSNAISPGTEFMTKLDEAILKWMNNYKQKEIIYSSCFTPGEGEHKLLQFIKTGNKKYKHIIYGLDADLIFLALGTGIDKIYLLREAMELDRNSNSSMLNYISIKITRESIVATVQNYLNKSTEKVLNIKLEEQSVINDFIFLCFFLGNDFLPHLHALDIHNNGIEILLKCYVSIFHELLIETGENNYLINNKNINELFLLKLVEELSKKEEGILRTNFGKNKRRIFCDGDAFDREICRVDNLLFNVEDPIQIGSDEPKEWEKRFYEYYYSIPNNKMEVLKEKIVQDYIIGLKWVTQYYLEKCPSWDWYFPYDYPPFLSDINKYIKSININKIKFKIGKPIKPLVQLLSILPLQSNYLIPKPLRVLMTDIRSPIKYLYPETYELDFINKSKYYLGIPKIPPLNIELINKTFEKYEEKLNKKYLVRNKNRKIKIIKN